MVSENFENSFCSAQQIIAEECSACTLKFHISAVHYIDENLFWRIVWKKQIAEQQDN